VTALVVATQPGSLASVEVVERVGITYRQLDYWARTARLTPSAGETAPGSGGTRWWTDADVAALVRIKDRLDFGMTLTGACRLEHEAASAAPPSVLGADLAVPA
jgi:DNA-binding transcriptional MerR regulator